MRLRVGRKLGRTLYRMVGAEPSDEDIFVGVVDTPEIAEEIVEAMRRMDDEWEAPFIGTIWDPRYPDDEQHEDPLKVCDHHGGCPICAVLDGGSSTRRLSSGELNLYYRRRPPED